MRIEQLEAGLDRYGGDLRRWPDALRADAEALIGRDPAAARVAATAARLDATLTEAMKPLPVGSALMGRIVSATHGGHAAGVTLRPTPRLAAWGFAAVLVFLTAGYAAGVALPASQGEDALAGLMFGNSRISLDADTTDNGDVL